ncbi:MAG: PolC-type DNA polymerase III, partial [Firmicutes bacterium]|nr:PolC-type DNA polymerase III [Bacillota bacterium]
FFQHDEEQYRKSEEQAEQLVNNYVPVRPMGSNGKGSAGKFDGKQFLGKPIEGTITPIMETQEGMKGEIIQGEVFDLDIRTGKTKTGKDYALATFAIYDGSGTMPCKVFFYEDKWKSIEGDFKDGIYIKIRGNIIYDEYARRIVMDCKSIELAERQVRTDDMEEKRVELHAHTKMSDMDGLSDPKELVKLAASWGHKAVAVTDHGVVQAFPDVMHAAEGSDIKVIYGMEGYVYDDKDGTVGHKDTRTNHIILLAKNQQGIKDLYTLVSESHLHHFYYRPRIPKSLIAENREGLIVGSACVAGEFFSAIVAGATDEELMEIAEFYDYLEIMPLVNNQFMVRENKFENVNSDQDLIDMNMRVIKIGEMMGKPVVATCDAHYLNEDDAIYRKVLKAGQHYDDADEGDGLFLRTTQEMLDEFSYLDPAKAREIVIENPNKIADMVEEEITPIAKGKFPPKIENSEEILRRTCENNAAEKYGTPLPDPIRKRLDKELDSIIGNGYAVMYISAKMLVDKSMSDGYGVGSRGSVGSSFAATMSGITEVNPLPAHYVCPACKHIEWGDPSEYECGIDMPPKECPTCGTMMDRDGPSIPFETFLGFEGHKEPDIDLNFAGEYQATAHRFVDEIFGRENVFKAGTISTVKYLTAKAFTEKYYEERGQLADKYEVDRIANHCVGVKRTTGQHPGGIIILPMGHEITEFCPVQRPANDSSSDITTTHFDYHSIDENLLKLDILGHDAPSIIRHLYELTGVDPMTTPMDDADVNALFNGTDSLGIKYDDYRFKHGSYGIPEFGTSYVRQMLDDTKPSKFADLIRISGLSHGTNVWTGNAQEFIRNGQTTIEGAICTSDDIMNYLINQVLPSSDAFNSMEAVRKGK